MHRRQFACRMRWAVPAAVATLLAACVGAPAQRIGPSTDACNTVRQPSTGAAKWAFTPSNMIDTVNAHFPQATQSEGRPPVDPFPPVTPASFRHKQLPTYPASALSHHRQGAVVLRILVSVDGKPRQVVVDHSSGYKSLDTAARKAVQHSWFNPATRNGIPVETWQRVQVYFQHGGAGIGRLEVKTGSIHEPRAEPETGSDSHTGV